MNTHHVGGRSALATALAVLLGGAAAAGAAPADKLIETWCRRSTR